MASLRFCATPLEVAAAHLAAVETSLVADKGAPSAMSIAAAMSVAPEPHMSLWARLAMLAGSKGLLDATTALRLAANLRRTLNFDAAEQLLKACGAATARTHPAVMYEVAKLLLAKGTTGAAQGLEALANSPPVHAETTARALLRVARMRIGAAASEARAGELLRRAAETAPALGKAHYALAAWLYHAGTAQRRDAAMREVDSPDIEAETESARRLHAEAAAEYFSAIGLVRHILGFVWNVLLMSAVLFGRSRSGRIAPMRSLSQRRCGCCVCWLVTQTAWLPCLPRVLPPHRHSHGVILYRSCLRDWAIRMPLCVVRCVRCCSDWRRMIRNTLCSRQWSVCFPVDIVV